MPRRSIWFIVIHIFQEHIQVLATRHCWMRWTLLFHLVVSCGKIFRIHNTSCTSRGIIMLSTEGSQFPCSGSCQRIVSLLSLNDFRLVANPLCPAILSVSLSRTRSLKITILNLFGNVVNAGRSSRLVRMEKRKKSKRLSEGYKARFEGSIQYRAFTSDPWSERRGNHLVSSKKNRYRDCGVVKSTFNENTRRWERDPDILSFTCLSPLHFVFSFLFLCFVALPFRITY